MSKWWCVNKALFVDDLFFNFDFSFPFSISALCLFTMASPQVRRGDIHHEKYLKNKYIKKIIKSNQFNLIVIVIGSSQISCWQLTFIIFIFMLISGKSQQTNAVCYCLLPALHLFIKSVCIGLVEGGGGGGISIWNPKIGKKVNDDGVRFRRR